MLPLLLSIGCLFTMAMLLKLADIDNMNSVVLTLINYVAGSLVGWALIVADGGTTVSATTVWLGLAGGIIWPLPFFILTRTINALGVAIAAPLARFGLIVPVLFGLVFLGESLSALGVFGLVGALIAIILLSPLNRNHLEAADRKGLWLIPIMIFMIGLANLWVNLFNHLGDSAETNLFFTLVFTFSTVFCSTVVWIGKHKVERRTVIRGSAVGVVNFFYTYFLLAALRAPLFVANSSIVFIALNVSYMLLVFAAGWLVWRESVTRNNVFGVCVAAVSLLLLNIR